jgi:stress response protein YsnF
MAEKLERDRKVVPVVEERAAILKRKVLTEGVRVRTVVTEREAVVDEPLASEDVEVERVVIDRWVDEPIPVRQDGDTTVITLMEEVVVVEKRLRAIEELRLTKRRSLRHAPQTVTLRREEAVIERLDAAGSDEDPS